ncbi:glycosyltransferase family 4 protein [Clostridium sp. HBUAS56017]|uniref:glycosyltransferase family 4 protein n=1 Tax=Clostridium sp. HBUAS56017 TaxID=2571128 RepID=UPI001177CC76|nr:glycosyltransferase family 4 protein [Clostridium sp. HBUAS56017]
MKLGIIRLYAGESGKLGYYNVQEIGLAKALAKKGVSTDIFFLTNKNRSKDVTIQEINEKVRIIYIQASRMYNHGIISPKFILDYNIDIVHLLSDNQLMVPSFIKFCNKHNIPIYNYIGVLQSDSRNKVKKLFMNILAERNIRYFKKSKLVVKTPIVKEQFEVRGINNVRTIPVGLDLDVIEDFGKSKFDLRRELNLPINKRVLIFVGRLEEYKEPLKAIEVLKELKKINDDYILIIIGKGSLKNKICGLIQEYGLDKDIVLIDKVENSKIHSYYKASDIFLNFNSQEIFGMSILEAMYGECKVIARDAPGPSYIIDDKINGIIMKDYDMTSWIKAIEKNINNRDMSKLGKEKIIKRFNWNNIAEEYMKLFKEIKGE